MRCESDWEDAALTARISRELKRLNEGVYDVSPWPEVAEEYGMHLNSIRRRAEKIQRQNKGGPITEAASDVTTE